VLVGKILSEAAVQKIENCEENFGVLLKIEIFAKRKE
jgi:hypothetical protein